MLPRALWLQAIWVSAAFSGCLAEVEDPAAADAEAVLDHVEALGFERGEAVVLEDRVVVGGDLLFDRAALARGEYERPVAVESGELIEKGYRYPTLVAEKHRGNIRLLFARGRFAPSKQIRSAFIDAAKAWSSIPGSSIRISPDNTGPAIVVRTVPVPKWDEYAGCKDTDACAYAPSNGRPGYDLFVRAKSVEPGCEDWSPSLLAYMARHEIGHAIGFAHPKEDGTKHVRDTASCSGTARECVYVPGYSTVMGAADRAGSERCKYQPARVTMDDYATCARTYPEK